MDFVDRGDDRPEPVSIARCRELLGDEADTLTDRDVEMMCRHAETLAQIVVQMFVESRRILGNHRAFSTHLARAPRLGPICR
jgi:hypothetical protein